ncbi:uncharacterized protein B0T23DRAFT_317802 [Neurospora hispaniola]|uniref:Uncharacterized protein n=1 Tax=Neurospora hispaniola TaxID=588809 RepID=A0AAJ0I7E1_9PEZI|nr:hypothetical protein B0T23DRAFT_317802 [Neurospora hispaniola]
MRSPFGTTGLTRSLGLVALALSTTCTGIYIPSARVPLPASLARKDATTITVTTVSTAGTTVTNLEADSSVSVPTAATTPSLRRTRSRRPVTVVETVTATTVMETVTVTPAASSATNSVEDNNASSGSSDVSSISTEVVTDVVVVSPETVTIIYGGGVSSTDAGPVSRGVVSSASDVPSSSANAASTSIEVTTVTVFPEVVSTSTVGVSSSTDEVSDSASTNNAVSTRRTTITLGKGTTTATEAATSVEPSTSVQRTITIDTAALVTLPTSLVTLTRRADNKAAPSSPSSSDGGAISIATLASASPVVWNPLFGHGPVVVSTSSAFMNPPFGHGPVVVSTSSAFMNPLFGHGPVVVSASTLDAPETLSTVFVTAKRTGDAAVSSGGSSSAAASASTPDVVKTLPGIVIVSSLDTPETTLSTVFVTAKRTGDGAVSSSGSSSVAPATRASASVSSSGSSSSAAASASTSADAAPVSSTTNDRPLLTITRTSTNVTATVHVTVAPTRTSTSVTATVHVTVVTATVHVAVTPAAPTETRSTLQLAQANCLVCQDIFDDNGIVPPEKVPASAAYAVKRNLDSLEEPLNNTAPRRRIPVGKLISLDGGDDIAPLLIPPMLPTGGVVDDHANATVNRDGAVVSRQLVPPMMSGFSVATHITRSSFSPIRLPPVTNNADLHTTHSTHSPIRLAPITNNADHATRPKQTATPIRLAPINNITTPTGVPQPQPTDVLQPKPFINHAPLKDVLPGVVDNDHLEPLSQGTAKSRRAETFPLPPLNITRGNLNQAYNPSPKSTVFKTPATKSRVPNPLIATPNPLLGTPRPTPTPTPVWEHKTHI